MLKSCLERTSVRFLLEFRPTKLLTWHLAKAAQRKLYIPVLFFYLFISSTVLAVPRFCLESIFLTLEGTVVVSS